MNPILRLCKEKTHLKIFFKKLLVHISELICDHKDHEDPKYDNDSNSNDSNSNDTNSNDSSFGGGVNKNGSDDNNSD